MPRGGRSVGRVHEGVELLVLSVDALAERREDGPGLLHEALGGLRNGSTGGPAREVVREVGLDAAHLLGVAAREGPELLVRVLCEPRVEGLVLHGQVHPQDAREPREQPTGLARLVR